MFHSIAVSGSSFTATTPLGAKSIRYIFFEDKNGDIRTTRNGGDVETISITIDGKQVCRDLFVLPFCTSTLLGSNNRFPWQKVAIECNLNCNMSEVNIKTNAAPNSFNVVFVCSTEPVDESLGFEFFETKRLTLKTSADRATVISIIDDEINAKIREFVDSAAGKEASMPVSERWMYKARKLDPDGNIIDTTNSWVQEGSAVYNWILEGYYRGNESQMNSDKYYWQNIDETVLSTDGKYFLIGPVVDYVLPEIVNIVAKKFIEETKLRPVGVVPTDIEWNSSYSVILVGQSGDKNTFTDEDNKNWVRYIFSNANPLDTNTLNTVSVNITYNVNGIEGKINNISKGERSRIAQEADKIVANINKSFSIPKSEINYRLDKVPDKFFCMMLATPNNENNEKGYSSRVNSYMPLIINLSGSDADALTKNMALQLICANDNVPMRDAMWQFDKADGLTRNVIVKIERGGGFGTDAEVIKRRFHHDFIAYANTTLFVMFGYKKLV